METLDFVQLSHELEEIDSQAAEYNQNDRCGCFIFQNDCVPRLSKGGVAGM